MLQGLGKRMEFGACLDGLQLDAAVYLSGVTALGMGFLMIWILAHEAFSGRRYFITTVAAMVAWLICATAELATPALGCKVAMASATWPAIALAPVSWSLFVWHFCFSPPVARTKPLAMGSAALVVVISVAALSNPLHGLFYGPETTLVLENGRRSAQFDHGPLFHAASVMLYGVLLTGLGAATTAAFRASRAIRPMMMLLTLATAVPIAANLGYVAFDATVFGFDPTPFAFSFVLLTLTWAIYATRGFDLAAMARDLLYFNIHDPVLLMNANGILTGANPAATALLPNVVPGRPLDVSPPFDLLPRVATRPTDDAAQSEVTLGDRSFNMKVLPIPRPLGEQGDHLGVVAILSDVTQLKRKNAQLTEALEMSHAQLSEITRLREIAERLAMDDPLTGIGNRRSLMIRMEGLIDRPLAMAVIDIDHFKQVNDSFGHSVGDRVLRDFTATLRGLLPPTVELFRVGGEEFVLLAPDKPTVEVLTLLRRLNMALIETPPLREHDHKQLTFSAGVAARPGDGASFDDLYARADARLYQAKRSGRNRVMHVDCISFDDGGAVPGSSGIHRDPRLDIK